MAKVDGTFAKRIEPADKYQLLGIDQVFFKVVASLSHRLDFSLRDLRCQGFRP